MRKRMLSVAVWGVAAVLASAPARAQGPPSDAGGTLAGAGVQRPRPASSNSLDLADGPPAFGVPVEAFPDPVGADQLQPLIDQIALAFARAPFATEGRGDHQFLNTMKELKRLASPLRPQGTSVEDGVTRARKRLAVSLDVQRRLPVLLKDAPVKTGAAVP